MKYVIQAKRKVFNFSTYMVSTLLVMNLANAANYTTDPQDVVRTPGVGFQSSVSHRPTPEQLSSCDFDDNDAQLDAASLKSGSRYVRLFWQDFEPTDDDFGEGPNDDFGINMLHKILDCSHQDGQAVDLRIALSWPKFPIDRNASRGFPEGQQRSLGLPDWLVDKPNVYAHEITLGSPGYPYYIPIWDNYETWIQHAELIEKLGDEFDGHKALNAIDIGSVGFFGEWHFKVLGINGELDYLLPSLAKQEDIVNLYYEHFPNTPKMALEEPFNLRVEGGQNEPAGFLKAKNAMGWRGDGWGGEGSYFNNRYNNQHTQFIPDMWETGQISLEIINSSINAWAPEVINNVDPQAPDYLDYLWNSFDKAVDWHVTNINTKILPPNDLIASSLYGPMSYLAKKMGFRLVMWSAEPESNTVAAGEGLSVSMTWENKGIAPPYRDFRVAFRLKDSSGNVINGSTVISDLTVQGWLPGPAFFNSAVYNVPSGIAAGNYNLEIGVVFHADAGTVLPIVVNERNDDFWVPVPLGGSELTVTSNGTGGSSSSQIPSSYLQAVVPSNFDSAGKIIDGNTASSSGSWHNTNGIVADAEFEIKLNRRFNLTSLEYFDEHYRNLEITIFDGVNQVSQFNTTHSSANNGTLFTINNGDGHLATKVKIRNTAVYQGTSWLAPIEVKLNGIRVEDSFQRIEPGNENSLTAASNAPLWRIIDGLTSTGSWSNEGLPNEAHVDLYLEQTRKIFAVVYEDQYPRKLEVGIWNNGNLVSQQSFDTQSGYNELEVSDIVGDTVKIWSTNDYLSNGELWLSPKEIRVFGFPD